MNGPRLGTYQIFNNVGWTKNVDGSPNRSRSLLFSALAGLIAGAVASPFYLV